MSEPSPSQSDAEAEAGRLEAMMSDYVEGTLSLAERKQLEARLEQDPALREQLEEIRAAQAALKRLNKTPAPEELSKNVEEIIRRRSDGRFFGRRAFGDRVPFGVILIVALVALLALAILLWSSSTGSLRLERKDAPRPSPEARDAIPRP